MDMDIFSRSAFMPWVSVTMQPIWVFATMSASVSSCRTVSRCRAMEEKHPTSTTASRSRLAFHRRQRVRRVTRHRMLLCFCSIKVFLLPIFA